MSKKYTFYWLVLIFISYKPVFSQTITKDPGVPTANCSIWGDTTIVWYDKNGDTARIFSLKGEFELLNGLCVFFMKGKRSLSFCVENGKLQSAFKVYNSKGKLVLVDWYRDGYLLGGKTFYGSMEDKDLMYPANNRLYYEFADTYSKKGKRVKSKRIKEYPFAYHLAKGKTYRLEMIYLGDPNREPGF